LQVGALKRRFTRQGLSTSIMPERIESIAKD
jgi:hypothetical protein